MTPNNPERRGRGWLSPLIHLSNNWISLAGVVIVTTATIFWLFLLPVTLKGETENPVLRHSRLSDDSRPVLRRPAPDPAGHVAEAPAGRPQRHLSAGIPDPQLEQSANCASWFISSARPPLLNIAIASQLTYSAVNYMDSVTFCGKTCHTVMQPEFTAYQNSPHSRVECVKCHIGPGAGWFVKSKLSGAGRCSPSPSRRIRGPFPTPVHNLRPARETCEACHWPQKYGEDRIRVINKFADDETNSAHQDRAADEDRRRQSRHRHSRHAPGARASRSATATPTSSGRTSPGWNTTVNGKTTVYATADAKPDGAGLRCARWTAWTATTGPRTVMTCRSAAWTKPWPPG